MNQLTIILAILLLSLRSLAQTDSIQITYSPGYNCSEGQLNITGYVITNNQPELHVDWGDGSDTIVLMELLWDNGVDYYWSGGLFGSHAYNYSGTYTIQATIVDAATLAPYSNSQTIQNYVCGMDRAGSSPMYMIHNSNAFYLNNYYSFPVDFINVENVVTTAYTDSTFTLDSIPVNLYPQVARINPDWLNATGFRQLSPDIHFSDYHIQDPNYPILFDPGYPAFWLYHVDSVNLDNRITEFTGSFNYNDPYETGLALRFNNSALAKPDSIIRVRIEASNDLIFDTMGLLNPLIDINAIEFDVPELNLYKNLTVLYHLDSSLLTNTEFQFKAFFADNLDIDPLNDTITYLTYYNSPCAGLSDSVLTLSTNSTISYYNNEIQLNVAAQKTICDEVDSIQIIVIKPSNFLLDSSSVVNQNTFQSGDSLFFDQVSIPQYSPEQVVSSDYELSSGYGFDSTYFFEVLLIHGSDTSYEIVPVPLFFSSTDFGLDYFTLRAVAPTQSGFIDSYINGQTQGLGFAEPTQVVLTFPAYITPDTTNLNSPVIVDSTLSFYVLASPNQLTFFHVPFTLPGNIVAGTPIAVRMQLFNVNDSNPVNDTITAFSTVLNSYDPNEKHTVEAATLDPDIRDTLTYVIHFQNDGNFPALNIHVRDTLSESLDLTTFRFIASKHPSYYTLDSNSREVVFYFDQINLAPSAENLEDSQGFFSYQIAENTAIAVNESIENTAYIFFDFNPAIVTNTTQNTNQYLSLEDLQELNVVMYPNPASETIWFKGENVESVTITDLTGKLIVSESLSNNFLSIVELNNGFYIVQVSKGTAFRQFRLLIER